MNSNEYSFENNYGYSEDSSNEISEESMLRLNANDLAEITRKFSGLKSDGKPKASLSYCAYDFDAPEDDVDKSTICFPEPSRIELSIDKATGFYTLDVIFKDEKDPTLKMMWARLQRHKSNEVYQCDKTWIFYMKLMEENDVAEGALFTADILNPLSFYLIRTVPDQYIEDYEVESGVYCGGNTIRFLLHRDLVTFQYEDIDLSDIDNEDENGEDTDDDWVE